MKFIDLAVKRYGSNPYTKPKLMQFHVDRILGGSSQDSLGNTTFKYDQQSQPAVEIVVAESFGQIETAAEPFAATNLYPLDLKTAVSAGATQTQVGATALTAYLNIVSTAAANGDGVKLPVLVAGVDKICVIINNTAFTLQVWPATGDKIEAIALNLADTIQVPVGGKVVYWSKDDTTWYRVLPTNV